MNTIRTVAGILGLAFLFLTFCWVVVTTVNWMIWVCDKLNAIEKQLKDKEGR